MMINSSFLSAVLQTRKKLIIVGDGWMRELLKRDVATLGLSQRVKFVGFLPDHEMMALMKAADVLVVPSVYEPFGMVALEGMASGVPVVASNVDGLSEIISHEDNGISVYPRDPSSIAWGINRVLSDPKNAARIVKNALKDVRERFSWEAVAKRTEEVYRRALELSVRT